MLYIVIFESMYLKTKNNRNIVCPFRPARHGSHHRTTTQVFADLISSSSIPSKIEALLQHLTTKCWKQWTSWPAGTTTSASGPKWHLRHPVTTSGTLITSISVQVRITEPLLHHSGCLQLDVWVYYCFATQNVFDFSHPWKLLVVEPTK